MKKNRALLILFFAMIAVPTVIAVNQALNVIDFSPLKPRSTLLMSAGPLQSAAPLQSTGPLQPAGPLQSAMPLQMIVPPSDFGGAQGPNTSLKWSGNIESLPDFLDVLNRIVITEWPDGTNSYILLPQVVGNLTKDSVLPPIFIPNQNQASPR